MFAVDSEYERYRVVVMVVAVVVVAVVAAMIAAVAVVVVAVVVAVAGWNAGIVEVGYIVAVGDEQEGVRVVQILC